MEGRRELFLGVDGEIDRIGEVASAVGRPHGRPILVGQCGAPVETIAALLNQHLYLLSKLGMEFGVATPR